MQQVEISHYQNQIKDLEKKIIVLSEQHQQLSLALQQVEDKIETLRHEKLFLAQEKAELATSLNHLKFFNIN